MTWAPHDVAPITLGDQFEAPAQPWAGIHWSLWFTAIETGGLPDRIGALTATLGAATAAGAGAAGIAGAEASALSAAATTAAGAVAIAGAATRTLGIATVASATAVAAAGAESTTLGAATGVGTGAVGVGGAVSAALGNTSASSAGNVGDPILLGVLELTLGGAVASASGAVDVVGVGAAVGLASVVSAGAVEIVGDGALLLDSLTSDASGSAVMEGVSELTLDDAGVSSEGGVEVSAAVAVTLGGVSSSANAVNETPPKAPRDWSRLTNEDAPDPGSQEDAAERAMRWWL